MYAANVLLFRNWRRGFGKTYQTEKCEIRKDRELVWRRIIRVLVGDVDGNPAYCIGDCSVTLPTVEKGRKRPLRESRDSFSKMFRSCPVAHGNHADSAIP